MSNRRKTRPSVCTVDPRIYQISPPRYRSRGAGVPFVLALPGLRTEPVRRRDRRAKTRRRKR